MTDQYHHNHIQFILEQDASLEWTGKRLPHYPYHPRRVGPFKAVHKARSHLKNIAKSEERPVSAKCLSHEDGSFQFTVYPPQTGCILGAPIRAWSLWPHVVALAIAFVIGVPLAADIRSFLTDYEMTWSALLVAVLWGMRSGQHRRRMAREDLLYFAALSWTGVLALMVIASHALKLVPQWESDLHQDTLFLFYFFPCVGVASIVCRIWYEVWHQYGYRRFGR